MKKSREMQNDSRLKEIEKKLNDPKAIKKIERIMKRVDATLKRMENARKGIEDEKKLEKFLCPICGGKEYAAVYVTNDVYGPGFRVRARHYICSDCSVSFHDPKRFTSAKKRSNNKKEDSLRALFVF